MLFYPVDNNNDLIVLLKQVDAKVLLDFVPQITEVSGLGRHVTEFIWSPVVERNKEIALLPLKNETGNSLYSYCTLDPRSVEPFLTVTPMDKLNEAHFKSDVDTMFGYTEMVKYSSVFSSIFSHHLCT